MAARGRWADRRRGRGHGGGTLFHYRNHGAAYGRVLSGIQVPRSERARLNQELAAIGYPWWDESENPAYRLFLG